MMEAAMNDMPTVGKNPKKSDNLFNIDEENGNNTEECSPNSATTENTDDEFIMIEKVNRSRPANKGVTEMGDQFQTRFDMGVGGDFEFVTTQIHANNSTPLTGHLDDLPSNLPPPLFRSNYQIKGLSIILPQFQIQIKRHFA